MMRGIFPKAIVALLASILAAPFLYAVVQYVHINGVIAVGFLIRRSRF